MTDEQQAAFIFSQSICALAHIEGMKAENASCKVRNEYPAWTRDDFLRVIDEFDISYNAVVGAFRS